ncbi:phosphatase PAP2 family protein [Bacteroidota bacterium]
MLFIKRFLIIFITLSQLSHVTLPAQISDSVAIAPVWYQKKAVSTLLVPSILIGAGIATMNDNGFYSSQDAYECIQRNYLDFSNHIDDHLIYIPVAGAYVLNFAGVKGKNNFFDRSVICFISFSLATITFGTVKKTSGVLRPDGSDFRSLPSGHTTLAFVSATILHEEYKEKSIWYSVAGYSIATATGAIRMLNNKHWMSDVFVGAGLGILTTKTVYLVYPVVKKWIISEDKGRSNNNLTLAPNIYPGHYGIYLQYRIH